MQRVVIIDIDGLRRDVFRQALAAGDLPHVERIVGGPEGQTAVHVDALSTVPSITFAAQASIVTGQHPAAHGVAGNELFDRLGRISGGRPRHFGFDVGDTLAVDDAVRVFSDGLASRFLRPQTPTLYESAAARSRQAAVFYHMFARGAATWVPPSVVDIARFTKGRGRLGLEAGAYDAGMLDRLIDYLETGQRPDILTAYLMGLDHHSHLHGPASQHDYLRQVIDPQIGRLLDALTAHDMLKETLFVLVSDHGQIDAVPDDRHALRLGFPFDPELVHVFKALRLDVHDIPGEDPACDAVMGLNGSLAHVYLQHRTGRWADPPRYADDVLPVAEAFHQMNERGQYAPELEGSLELILVRNAGEEGWGGAYRAYLGNGQTQALADYLAAHPELDDVDAVHRLRLAASEVSGDLILAARAGEGFYFGSALRGVHGSLWRGDSEVVLTFAWPGASAAEMARLRQEVEERVAARCAAEGDRQPSVADMAPVVLGWL